MSYFGLDTVSYGNVMSLHEEQLILCKVIQEGSCEFGKGINLYSNKVPPEGRFIKHRSSRKDLVSTERGMNLHSNKVPPEGRFIKHKSSRKDHVSSERG